MLPKWMRKTWCLDKWFSFNSALDRWKDWLHKTVRMWQTKYVPTCYRPKWMRKMWMWTSWTRSGLWLLRSCRLHASVSSAKWMQQKEAKVLQIWVGCNFGNFDKLFFSTKLIYFLDYKSTVEIVKYANVKRCRNVLLLTTALKRKVSWPQFWPKITRFLSLSLWISTR